MLKQFTRTAMQGITDTSAAILDRLLASPMAAAIAEEMAAEQLADRRLRADAIRRAEEEHSHVRQVWDDKLAPARAALAVAETRVRDSRHQLRALEHDRAVALTEIQRRIDGHRAWLESTAPSILGTIRDELQTLIEQARLAGHTQYAAAIDGRRVATHSNGASIRSRMDAVMAIQRWLRELAIEPLTDDEIRARVDARIAALPPIELVELRSR